MSWVCTHVYLYGLTFPMGIAYTLKQFYHRDREVYIVAGMYETAFDQKYICSATSSVILLYPQQYIKIELDCYQIKIISMYVPFIYA